MDGLGQVADWLREQLSRLPVLDQAQQIIERVPDWALISVAATVVAAAPLLAVWVVSRKPGRADHKARNASQINERPELGDAVAGSNRSPVALTEPIAVSAQETFLPPDENDDTSVVRVFVSSTFLDMQVERNELVKKTFPELRRRLRTRGVELMAVDLRWGITEEQSQRGETLPTLLAEVDRCRPYFIGLLGQRYGWKPPETALTEGLKASFPPIANTVGVSVTEMEIIQGVLSHPESAKRALFFVRDPAYDWIATLNKDEREACAAETDADRAKLTDLKDRIRASGALFQTYLTPYDIGPAVEAALGVSIEAQFPEEIAFDEFTQMLRLHRAYSRERRGLHIGADAYLARLDHWMSERDAAPILITGASGSGKSTLIANWLHSWRCAHPKDIVFEHYVGASARSSDPMLLMRRLWAHLNRATGEIVELPKDNAELMDVSASLGQRLAQANLFAERMGVRVLIVLDGLDTVPSERDWLPKVPGVKLVASSLSSDGFCFRGWDTVEVNPLTDIDQRAFIDGTLKGWSKRLLPRQIAGILAHAEAGNPLFLKTVLEELRVSAAHVQLDERLGFYLKAHDMPDLFSRVLERLEADCEPGLAARALSLIWASSGVLDEPDIIAVTGASPLAWATLSNGLGDSLRERAGRIAFSHDYLSMAVERRYLTTDPADLEKGIFLTGSGAEGDRQLFGQIIESVANALGPLNPSTLDITVKLADTLYYHRGGMDAAEDLYERVLEARIGIFPPEHPSIQEVRDRFGEIANDVGRSMGTLDAFPGDHASMRDRLSEKQKRCIALAKPQLGPVDQLATELSAFPFGSKENPVRVSHVSGETFYLQNLRCPKGHKLEFQRVGNGGLGPYANIVDEYAVACPACESAPTIIFLDMYHYGYQERLQSPEGFRIAEDYEVEELLLENYTRSLGPDDSSTQWRRDNLAQTLQRTLEARTSQLGPEHSDTLQIAEKLAQVHFARGDLGAAKKLQEYALEVRTRLLGPGHPDTLNSMSNLASTLQAGGELDGALKMAARMSNTMLS